MKTAYAEPWADVGNNVLCVQAQVSYLARSSMAGPLGEAGASWSMTAEYGNAVAAETWFDFSKKTYGVTHSDYKYTDGNHYRGRTPGFSLANDWWLLSLIDTVTGASGHSYRFEYDRADINLAPPGLTAEGGAPANVISAHYATTDRFELGFEVSWRAFTLNAAIRAQDAQLDSEPNDGKVTGEIGIAYRY